MAITRTKKEAVVGDLRNIIRDAQTLVFVRFNQVTSEEVNALRDACHTENVGYTVAKKTLIRKAFEDSSIEGAFPELEGEVAVAYSTDMLASAQVMGSQAEKLENRVSILGGVFGNAFVSQEKMQSIANIPPMKTLYAQFLMVIRSPVQQFASVLSQIADKKN